MPSDEVGRYLEEMHALQRQILEELGELPREAFRYETDSPRWNTVRRVLLRFGDHVREHTTQLAAAREAIGADQTMTERILAQAQWAYGYFLGAMVGLQDEDLDREPEPGEWSVRQVLEHMVQIQRDYLANVRYALEQRKSVERD